MANKKKVNCKDDLNNTEEIQARRMRRLLEQGDEELIEQVKTLYTKWYKKPDQGFLKWLIAEDKKILSSALNRMDDWTILLT